jgi:hypothetical protein
MYEAMSTETSAQFCAFRNIAPNTHINDNDSGPLTRLKFIISHQVAVALRNDGHPDSSGDRTANNKIGGYYT